MKYGRASRVEQIVGPQVCAEDSIDNDFQRKERASTCHHSFWSSGCGVYRRSGLRRDVVPYASARPAGAVLTSAERCSTLPMRSRAAAPPVLAAALPPCPVLPRPPCEARMRAQLVWWEYKERPSHPRNQPSSPAATSRRHAMGLPLSVQMTVPDRWIKVPFP